eukprot:TRINITY_DN8502_c0_g1_i2.p1 TRINITY_DN8502_c0_g1~~TRINITY_DN8502_c0_g1_i2.p1  ORF type:complete len:982 (+),score=253.17 TRINITY_DN8502_c0_g1_i2:44-2947(+)
MDPGSYGAPFSGTLDSVYTPPEASAPPLAASSSKPSAAERRSSGSPQRPLPTAPPPHVCDGEQRIFPDEPLWPLAEGYRRGPLVEEKTRIPKSSCTLIPLAVLGVCLVACVILVGIAAATGAELDAFESGERCVDVSALRSDPALLLDADGYSGIERGMARPHPSGWSSMRPGQELWSKTVRRCRDIKLSAVSLALCSGILSLVVMTAIARVVLHSPFGLNAQPADFDSISLSESPVVAQRLVALFRRSAQRMCQVHDQVKSGSHRFIKTSLRWMVPSGIGVALLATLADVTGRGWKNGVCCLLSMAACSLAGWLGVWVAARTNARVTFSAARGLSDGLRLALNSGLVMALAVSGTGVLLVTLLLLVFRDTRPLAGAALGASWVAVFYRYAGGIFAKAADVGAEVSRRAEGLGGPAPTNPAVVAALVGDNIGGVAGAGADLLQTNVMVLAAAVHLGGAPHGPDGIALPLFLSAAGTFSSLLACFVVPGCTPDVPPPATGKGSVSRAWREEVQRGTMHAFRVGGLLAVGMSLVLGGLLCGLLVGWRALVAYVLGTVTGLMCSLGMFTEYATSGAYRPTQTIAEEAIRSAATVIVRGLTIGMLSSAAPVLFIFATVVICTMLGESSGRRGDGEYCVAVAGLGMLSTQLLHVAGQCFAAVTDNAGGLGRLCVSSAHTAVRQRTDALDALGNSSSAAGKGLAAAASTMAGYCVFLVFTQEALSYTYDRARPGAAEDSVVKWVGDEVFLAADVNMSPGYSLNGLDKRFVAGLLLGAAFPFALTALAIDAVSESAAGAERAVREDVGEAAEEGRREAVLSGRALADTAGCVRRCTATVMRRTATPALLTNAGSAWENAKLYVTQELLSVPDSEAPGGAVRLSNTQDGWRWTVAGEDGTLSAKLGPDGEPVDGEGVYSNVCVGDVVGDPFKDAAGPGINTMLKLLCCAALVVAPAVRSACDRQPVWSSHCFSSG